MPRNETELAWAAGLFDGEGTFGAYKNGDSILLLASVPQVDRQVLDRFAEAVGAGKVYGPYVRPERNWQTIHRYRLTGHRVTDLMDMLWPYLSELKKKQAQEAAFKWRARPNARRQRD